MRGTSSSNSSLYGLLINRFGISHNHAYYLLYSTLYDITEHIIIGNSYIINNNIIDTYILYDKYIRDIGLPNFLYLLYYN